MLTELNNLIFAIVVSILWIFLLMPLASRFRLVDKPSERKKHSGHVPLVGGIAICLTLLSAVFWAGLVAEYMALLAAMILLLVTGVIDDFIQLSALFRFAVQAAAVLIMAFGGHTLISSFGELLWPGTELVLGLAAIPLTVFATVGIINAFNMSDGVDGLAASLALVTLSSLAWLYDQGSVPIPFALMVVIGNLIGFLLFNMRFPWQKQARIFLGDAGSMVLGFVITWYLVAASQGEHAVMKPVTALWLVALPLFDTISVMTRRMIAGISPFKADRKHLHHAFLLMGLSPAGVQWLSISLAVLFSGIGIAGEFLQFKDAYMFYVILGLGLIFHFWMLSFWAKQANQPVVQKHA
ncbi:MAG: UDP-N-acetylglucosamine--undecaprenyl-phosphate N-acetylglucosaminephosphotransferase [bacterium]